MREPKQYTHNLMPFLSSLDPDDAGPNPMDVSLRYDVPVNKILMLSRNENPYGPSPKVLEAIKSTSLNRYPNSKPFLEALSAYTGYPEENIIAGAGMDEIIAVMPKLFLGPGDKALIPVPTYNLYAWTVRLCGAVPYYQSRLLNFDINPEIPDNMKLIFLCSPNNPTGNTVSEDTARAISESTEGIVFLDEAYAEFAEKDLINLVGEFDNIIVGRTLSKAFGLAGLRLGYAVAPKWIAEQYRRISPLFSISSVSLSAGIAALKDIDYMRETARKIVSERERMLRSLEGAHPSQGNFLYIHTNIKSKLVVNRLHSKGVIVRDCTSYPGSSDHCIRVTVGTTEQNDRFLEAFGWANGRLDY